jgi:hypothetical protein
MTPAPPSVARIGLEMYAYFIGAASSRIESQRDASALIGIASPDTDRLGLSVHQRKFDLGWHAFQPWKLCACGQAAFGRLGLDRAILTLRWDFIDLRISVTVFPWFSVVRINASFRAASLAGPEPLRLRASAGSRGLQHDHLRQAPPGYAHGRNQARP